MRPATSARSAVRIGITTSVLVGVAMAAMLLSGAVDPVDLITPGGRGPSAALIATDFGATAVPPDRTGYDGQQFYAVAREFPDLRAAAAHLDAPRYRLLRIIAPALASIGGEGTPVILALLVLNVLGVGLACGALALLCADRGWSPGLGHLAVVPVLFGVIGSTSDPLALGLALTGIALASRGRHASAVAVLIAAALTREQMAAVAIGVAAGLLVAGHRPRAALLAYGAPLAVVVGWYLILGCIVGGELPDRIDVLAMLSTGSEGFLVGSAALAISLWGAWAWRTTPTVWPVCVGFGLWTLVYFAGTFDLEALPRTTAPSLAFGLAAMGSLRRTGVQEDATCA